MKIRTILAAFALSVAAPALPVVASNAAQAQTVAYAERGTTNLRGGPWHPFRGDRQSVRRQPSLVHDSQRGWYYVTVNGQRGWMAGSRLRFSYARAPIPVPQPYYVPAPRPYFYGPSFSFRFGDFDRDRRHRKWNRRDRDDDWRWRRWRRDEGEGWGHRGD